MRGRHSLNRRMLRSQSVNAIPGYRRIQLLEITNCDFKFVAAHVFGASRHFQSRETCERDIEFKR